MKEVKMAVSYEDLTISDWEEIIKKENFQNPEELENFDNPWKKVGALLKNMFILNDKKREEKKSEILAGDNEEKRIKDFIVMLFDKVNNINNGTRKDILAMIPLNEDIKQMVISNYDRSPGEMLFVVNEMEEVMYEAA